jgi:hypothetical protein
VSAPLQYIHIGVGGVGQHWCTTVLPRLKELGLAEPVAAVDIDREILGKAKSQLGLHDGQLYTSAAQALAELFVNWLNGGEPPPNTLDDNIQCCALLFAAIESAHTGRVIDVQAFLRANVAGQPHQV